MQNTQHAAFIRGFDREAFNHSVPLSLSHAALKHHTCPLALGDVHIEDTKVNISKQFCLVLSLSTLPTLRSVSKLNK